MKIERGTISNVGLANNEDDVLAVEKPSKEFDIVAGHKRMIDTEDTDRVRIHGDIPRDLSRIKLSCLKLISLFD